MFNSIHAEKLRYLRVLEAFFQDIDFCKCIHPEKQPLCNNKFFIYKLHLLVYSLQHSSNTFSIILITDNLSSAAVLI